MRGYFFIRRSEFHKKFCFMNNIRSKYFTISILVFSLLLCTYDIIILQKSIQFKFFLSCFKTDLILLVSSFLFMLFIFFNQVKSYKEIKQQHKFIHGLISFFILCWSAIKASSFTHVSESYIYFFIVILARFMLIY